MMPVASVSLFQPVAIALWITIPIVLAGLVHIAVIRLHLLKSLASVRLDFGATWAGKPLFGENKTLRGAIVMIGATAAWVLLQTILSAHWAWGRELAAPFQRMHPLVWGALAGAGYIAGELPNSFVKRQLGIGAGAIATDWRGPVFWTIDQIDSLIGVVIFLLPVWIPTASVVLALFVIALVVHPLVAFVMSCLGLKTRVG